MSGPLEGVKVVELGMWVAGPACGGILADWGADVVKLEPPGGGDPARTYQRLFGEEMPDNPVFEMDNRSKRSVAVDLPFPEGQALRSGAPRRGRRVRHQPAGRRRSSASASDPTTVMARCPGLVYQLITGYGMDGEDADRPAYDIGGFWARSGVADAVAHPRRAVAVPARRDG